MWLKYLFSHGSRYAATPLCGHAALMAGVAVGVAGALGAKTAASAGAAVAMAYSVSTVAEEMDTVPARAEVTTLAECAGP